MRKKSNNVEWLKKRIDALIVERPSHEEILKFFKEVMIEQYKIKPNVKTVPIKIDEEKRGAFTKGFSLMGRKDLNLDTASAARLFDRLCKVLSRRKEVSGEANRIDLAFRNKDINLVELFEHAGTDDGEYISAISKKLKVREDLLSFLAGNSVKPIFEAYASELRGYVDQGTWWRGHCPICGSMPFIAEFREEGERFLVCSLCAFEWRFTRLKCPFCENEDHQGLRYFYAEKEKKTVRVDVCEKCRKYIKTVDTRGLGEEIIPLVEDIGTFYLDVLAQKEGYTREGMIGGGLVSQ